MNIYFDICQKYPHLVESTAPKLEYINQLGEFIENNLQSVKDRMQEEEQKEPQAYLLVNILDPISLSFRTVGYSADLALIIQTITHTIDFAGFDDRLFDLHQAINN